MDALNLLHYVAALLFVAALGGAALLAKRYATNPGAFRESLAGKWNLKVPNRRLAVVETLMLGPKQRLLIIKRDNVEHLVLAGPDGTTVIESNITAQRP